MKVIIGQTTCATYLVWFAMTPCLSAQPDARMIFWNELIPGGAPGGSSALQLLKRSDLNGSPVETIATGTTSRSTEIRFEPTSKKLYWTTIGFIKRANLDGSNVVNVVTADPSINIGGLELVQATSKMYWTDPIRRNINAAEFDGTNQVVLFDGNDIRPNNLVYDSAGSRLVFANNGEGSVEGPLDKISSVNLNGSGFQTIASGIVQLTGIDIDPIAQKLYWVDVGFNALNDTALRRANLDGTGVETILANLPDIIIDIQLDPVHDAIYWTSRDEGLIKKSNLNGGDVHTVFAGLSEPHALLIIPEPTTAVLWLVGIGIVVTRLRSHSTSA